MSGKFDYSTHNQSIQNHTSRASIFSGRYFFVFIVLMTVAVFQVTFSRQIEFVSEEIELVAGDSTCIVNGLYWFRNASPNLIENTLFYPFAINKQLPYPDTMVVTDVSSGRQVHYTRGKSGISFGITIHASETVLYRVSYMQKTYALSMQYILRTTAQWGKPLEQALYRIRIPQKYILASSTLLFPYTYERDNEQVFETCEENFMPSTDFIIQWERRIP